MSETLVWQLLRTNSSFLVKRGQTKRDGGIQFSREPGNILNLNSFKYSGLANNNTINLSAGADGVNVALKVSPFLRT